MVMSGRFSCGHGFWWVWVWWVQASMGLHRLLVLVRPSTSLNSHFLHVILLYCPSMLNVWQWHLLIFLFSLLPQTLGPSQCQEVVATPIHLPFHFHLWKLHAILSNGTLPYMNVPLGLWAHLDTGILPVPWTRVSCLFYQTNCKL